MKQFTVAGKALAVFMAVIWMAGCASTEVAEDTSAADAARAAAAATAEQEKRAADEMAAKKAMQKALDDAAASAGNVVYFDFDQSTLSPATRRILDAHVALLKTNNKSVRLEGHTDERGTREYNMALGERRAKAVADYMSVNGVAGYRLETVSYGEENPAAMGSNAAAWAKNRRVVIK